MLTQAIKELVTLPVELFVQDEQVQAKLEKSLETMVDTVGFFTGDFSFLFDPDPKAAEAPSGEGAEDTTPVEVALSPAEHLLPWV